MDHLEFIKVLLEHDADPNARAKDNTLTRTIFTMQWFYEAGATPFIRAAQSSDTLLMQLLLDYGADPFMATDNGDTALTACGGIGWVEGVTYERSAKENFEAMRMLLDLGLDPNVGNKEGRTALMGAALKGRNDVIETLVARGAKKVTLRGPVTSIDWANPHAHVFVSVAEPGGGRANWAIELESPVDLRRQGWTRDALHVGEVVTVEGIAARDGSKQAWSLSIVVARTGQRVLFARPVAPPIATNKPTPRWPDGQPRLGAGPGETGYWARPSATTLVERGVAVQADANGLLTNVADAARVAPFQDWARDLYIYRQR